MGKKKNKKKKRKRKERERNNDFDCSKRRKLSEIKKSLKKNELFTHQRILFDIDLMNKFLTSAYFAIKT